MKRILVNLFDKHGEIDEDTPYGVIQLSKQRVAELRQDADQIAKFAVAKSCVEIHYAGCVGDLLPIEKLTPELRKLFAPVEAGDQDFVIVALKFKLPANVTDVGWRRDPFVNWNDAWGTDRAKQHLLLEFSVFDARSVTVRRLCTPMLHAEDLLGPLTRPAT